jgi:HSP20 family protein
VVVDPPLFERQRKRATMLMRFEPFRSSDRAAEDLLAENRLHQVPVDAYRRGNDFKVDLDLPGADPGSIDLTVQADLLTVRATRSSHETEGDEVQVAERGHGQFGRQLFLGESLDREHIAADYHDGVLTITIPVAEQVKPRKVGITHMGGMPAAMEAVTA